MEQIKTGAYDDVDQTVFKWFTSKRGQQIPIDASMLEGKATDFEKARNNKFQSFTWTGKKDRFC